MENFDNVQIANLIKLDVKSMEQIPTVKFGIITNIGDTISRGKYIDVDWYYEQSQYNHSERLFEYEVGTKLIEIME